MTLVRYESKDHVATITMDRASSHNALNNALLRALFAEKGAFIEVQGIVGDPRYQATSPAMGAAR